MQDHPYFRSGGMNRWYTLAAQSEQNPGKRAELVRELAGLDEALCLRAQAALEAGDIQRAERILETVKNQEESFWNWLRGEAHFAKEEYAQAARCYHKVEEEMPRQAIPRLEICYREMENYKMAYQYATSRTHWREN